MKKEEFEIKIAIIGYVSVGKSTLLNALFGNKYSDVAMKRATAAVNHFRISTSPDYSLNEIRSAESTLEETKKDNETLRSHAVDDEKTEGNNEGIKIDVKERYFTIALEEPLCKMRDNTSLVFIDIPGINEANRSMYKEYVNEKWDVFDCVVVVMDATQGACTDEQLGLLRDVRNNVLTKKEVPIIVLGNKADDPDNNELSIQVNELRDMVVTTFEDINGSVSFTPVSAHNAFVYRWASRLSFDDFLQLDGEFITKIGKELLGSMKWKKLRHEDQVREAYTAVSNKNEFEDRLKETNFDTFLKNLTDTIGGQGTQEKMLEKQQHVLLEQLASSSSGDCDIDSMFSSMRSIHHILIALGKPLDKLLETFWSLYEREEANALKFFERCPDVTVWETPMAFLCNYKSVFNETNIENTKALANAAIMLIRQQLGVIIGNASDCLSSSWYKTSGVVSTWNDLSPFDWELIVRSILTLGFEREFCRLFGREKIQLEMMLSQSNIASSDLRGYVMREILEIKNGVGRATYYNHYSGKNDPLCNLYWSTVVGDRPQVHFPDDCPGLQHVMEGKYNSDGEFVPKYEKSYKAFVHIDIPVSLEDPSHWGHLVYKFLELTTDK